MEQGQIGRLLSLCHVEFSTPGGFRGGRGRDLLQGAKSDANAYSNERRPGAVGNSGIEIRRPRVRTGLKLFLSALALVVLPLALTTASAGAVISIKEEFGPPGAEGGQFGGNPESVAVNSTGAGGVPAGTTYIVDSSQNRLEVFAPSHGFVSAWGFDVALPAASPESSATYEICTVALECKAGISSVSPALGGEFSGLQGVTVDQASGNVYLINSGFRRVEVFSATGSFVRAFGKDVVQAGKSGNANERQAVTVRATAGQFRLTFGAGGPGVSETGDLNFNAGAAEVQTALNALTNISTGGGSVTVSGGPGDEKGTKPYVVTFSGGPLAETDVAQLGALNGTTLLSGGDPSSSASVATTNSGATGFEVCAVAANCQAASASETGTAGAFANIAQNRLAVAPAGAVNAGNVLVTDRGNRRVSEYTSSGVFTRAFGWDTVESGPDNTTGGEFEVCKAEIDACKGPGVSGSAVGQFGNNGPVGIAEDSAGTIYTAETRSPNFRVQKFTLPGNVVTPAGVFAGSVLSATTEGTAPNNLAIDSSNNLIVTKGAPAGATLNCLNTDAPSVTNDRRLLTVSPAGTLLSTSLACFGNHLQRGLAIDLSTGTVYFTSIDGSNRVYVLGNVTPPAVTLEPVAQFDAYSASFEGLVDPEGPPAVKCRFDYITKAAAEANEGEAKPAFTGSASIPCPLEPGAGTTPIAVGVTTSALAPNTTYEARLVGFKAPFGDVATPSATQEFTTSPEPPPTTVTGPAAPITQTTARIAGLVNPSGNATEVHFEYGTAGPCSSPLCTSTASQAVGSTYIEPGKAFTRVTAELKELSPDTVYHYRLVGTNSKGTTEGADRSFTTRAEEPEAGNCPNEDVRTFQHSDVYLGDCRAIELVNNPDKGNQNVLANGPELGTDPLSADGSQALWTVTGGAPGGSSGALSTFLATRGTGGWSSRSVVPLGVQQLGGGAFTYILDSMTPDFSHFVFITGRIRLGGATGTISAVRLDAEQNQDVLREYEKYDGNNHSEVSEGGTHVLFIDPTTHQLEDIGAPTPEIVSVMPNGVPSTCGLGVEGQSFVGESTAGGAGTSWHPGYLRMSAADASRVYFETQPNGECLTNLKNLGLYVRNRETNTTTLIDPGADETAVGAIRATVDGRHFYFTTKSQLDPADHNFDYDIYRWDDASGESACLSCVVVDAKLRAEGAEFPPRVAISDDFSRIYFESENQLVPGEGEAGRPNLYLLSNGQIRLVASPSMEDGSFPFTLDYSQGGRSVLSADGEVLLFKAAADPLLDAQANMAPGELLETCKDAFGDTKPCSQLFRYDAIEESLECVSCDYGDLTDLRLSGNSNLATHGLFKLSGDGSTIAFITPMALIAADVNGSPDIYEWREGALHLVSDGVSETPLGASGPAVNSIKADGSDILFTLDHPGLTGFEQDGLVNLYDARVNGGFIPPPATVHCSEESCQGPLQAAPGLDQTGTGTYSGSGNLVEARTCRRGKVRRHGRCVARHKHKRRKHRSGSSHQRTAGAKQGRTK